MIALLSVALLAAPAGAAPAAAATTTAAVSRDDFDDAKQKAVEDYADDIAKIGDWCEKEDWFAEADRWYEAALEIDGDNRRARKGLGYKRVRGEWIREESKRRRNEERVDYVEVEERELEAREDQLDRMLRVIDKFEDEIAAERREAELWALLDAYPDEVELRRRLGYVEGWEGRPWVLPDSKVAKARREEIKALGKAVRDRAPEREATAIDGWEKDLGPRWNDSGRNDRVRAVTSNGPAELDDVLEVAWAAQDLVNEVFGIDHQLPMDCCVYLMSSGSEVEAFAANWPDTGRDRSMWPRLASTWLDEQCLGVWRDDRVARLDSVSRQMIAQMLSGAFKVSGRQGWIFEGFGLYLSYRLVNTRLSYFIRRTEYTDGHESNFNSRLRQSRANWFRLAHEVLSGEDKPNLVFVLGKDVNQLTPEDLLYGYALAAFILEVHGDEAARILTRIGDEDAPALVLEEELGRKLPDLEKHLVRWLDDVKE